MKKYFLLLVCLISNVAFADINPGGPTGPDSSNIEDDTGIIDDNNDVDNNDFSPGEVIDDDNNDNKVDEAIAIDEDGGLPDTTQNELDENVNELDPGTLNVDNSILKAKFFLGRGDNEKALAEVQKVLEVEPENADALVLQTEITGGSDNTPDTSLQDETLVDTSLSNDEDLADTTLPQDENTNIIDPNDSSQGTSSIEEMIKENLVIILVAVGSLVGIIIIVLFSKRGKNKRADNETDYVDNTFSSEEEDPLGKL